MSRKVKFLILSVLLACVFSGCATVSPPPAQKEAFYNLNGVNYFPLIALCRQRGLQYEYDTFSRTINLSGASHRINIRVGDSLALVDGSAVYLKHKVDFYNGEIVVPERFKEQVLDKLFKGPPSQEAAQYIIRKVVIDAGHGGDGRRGGDPGAIGKSGLREKDVNLDVAKRLSRILRQDGIEVVMTRSTDIFITLQQRVDIANNSGADLFISVHSNANRVRSLNGLEIYYVAPRASDSRRLLYLARNVSLKPYLSGLSSDSLDVKATLWDMIYTSNRADSVALARSICRIVDRNMDTRVIGIKSAAFYVLKGAQVPAILVEIGFLSNRQEERLLKNNYYRQQIAESIAQGVREYAAQYAYLGRRK